MLGIKAGVQTGSDDERQGHRRGAGTETIIENNTSNDAVEPIAARHLSIASKDDSRSIQSYKFRIRFEQ